MKTIKFKVTRTDKTIQERGYKYNVQVLINGMYCGEGKFCKDQNDVDSYIEEHESKK